MFLNDSESHIDLLNFQTTADSVASVILTNGDEPVSIGVFGDWGSGKSSLVRMIGEALSQRAGGEKLVFVEFNAWLYQGFDDAKMALLQCVSDRLIELSAKDATLAEKVCGFLRRIDVLRAAKIVLPLASSVLAGNAIGGPCGGIVGLATSVKSTGLAGLFKDAPAVIEAGEAALSASKSCIRPEAARSLPKEIADMRKSFEDILASAKVRLVVLVDDLDRCLPETAIETLEAMRLLLFTRNTIFIIAADEVAIRKAVSNRYASEDVEGKLTTSYFDKLIQIPLAVPHPSHNEIRCYLTALMAETACLAGRITRDELLNGCGKMSEILKSSWRGKVRTRDVDAAFGNAAMKIRGEIDLADQMVGVMSTAEPLSGNPRLMKRFVNAVVIRQKIAESQHVECPLDALIKLMLLERCAPREVFSRIHKEVLSSDSGHSESLAGLEDRSVPLVQEVKDSERWAIDWARLSPRLADMDLRSLMYLSRDVASWNYSVLDELSSDGREILDALVRAKNPNLMIQKRIEKTLPKEEASLVLRKLTAILRSRDWDLDVLRASLTIPMACPELQDEFVRDVLSDMPKDKLMPDLIPYLGEWASAREWLKDVQGAKEILGYTKKAIVRNLKGKV